MVTILTVLICKLQSTRFSIDLTLVTKICEEVGSNQYSETGHFLYFLRRALLISDVSNLFNISNSVQSLI